MENKKKLVEILKKKYGITTMAQLNQVELIAKTVYGEALVTQSDMEMAAVAWCILNRVDSPKYPDTIEEVVTQRRQFHGYSEEHPVIPRVEKLVRDVLDRWYAEKNGDTDCGRVLPKDYIYFEGNGRHNHYSTEWLSNEFYDWSLPNPYENCTVLPNTMRLCLRETRLPP